MKNLFVYTLFAGLICTLSSNVAFGETNFSRAIATCENFKQSEILIHQNEAYNVTVTLEKNKKNQCVYQEKITIGKNIHLLTCSFGQKEMKHISQLMSDFSNRFKVHMQNHPLYEAKLSTNSEIFQKYLTDNTYCKISGSQSK